MRREHDEAQDEDFKIKEEIQDAAGEATKRQKTIKLWQGETFVIWMEI